MKLAKKVLAIVMALGLIACMSAMAFATPGSYSTYVVATDKDGKNVNMTLYAAGKVGLASGTVTVTYNPDGVMFKYGVAGNEAKAVRDAVGNGFSFDINDTESGSGKVVYGFFFTDNLWDSATFENKGEVSVDVDNFDLAVLNFDVIDSSKANVTVEFDTKDIYGGSDGIVKLNEDLGVYAPKPDPKEVPSIPDTSKTEEKKDEQGKPVEETKAEAADAAKTNTGAKTAPKTDGGKNTGDNGVIAVVAGVIALAGAAFVVTKKRK